MDQRLKAFLVFGTISVIIYVIVLMTSPSEKSFVLTPSGNRDPTKQKLMVVDQDSGEISFVHKSLQGLNQGVTSREAVISEELAKLRSDLDAWNQDRYDEIQDIKNTYATKTDLAANRKLDDDRLKSLEGSISKKFGNNDRVYIKVNNAHYLGDSYCKGERFGHRKNAEWCDRAHNDIRLVKVDNPK